MAHDTIHRATSADGTTIAGRVLGQGPPLVLVHGGVGDGETSWRFLLPFLVDRYTCYAMSLRGRGLSAASADQSPQRLEDDVVAFVDSIGGPVAVLGHSSGGALSIGAATRTDRVSALILYEPALPELADGGMIDRWTAAFDAAAALADDEDRWADAAQVMLEEVALVNASERRAIAASGATEVVAPNVPVHVRETRPFLGYRPLRRLGRIAARTLLLRGQETHPSYAAIAETLAGRLPEVELVDVPGAGHMGPQVAPEAVATALTSFLAPLPLERSPSA